MIALLNPTFFFFFNDTATTEIYTLSLHDALPIYARAIRPNTRLLYIESPTNPLVRVVDLKKRSEEHTSELQSQSNLVCRLLLEKKKQHQHETKPPSQQYARNDTRADTRGNAVQLY